MTMLEARPVATVELPLELGMDSQLPLNREQRIEQLELIRDGESADDPTARALRVGQAAMYLLGDVYGSLEYPISARTMDAYRRPIIHDPTRPAHVEIYKFRQPGLPLLSLITGRRYKGRFDGPETVVVLPYDPQTVEELPLYPRLLFATDQGHNKRVFAADEPTHDTKSYADFVTYAAGVMYEVLATPE